MKYSVRVQDRVFDVTVDGRKPDYELRIDGLTFRVDATALGDESLLTMLIDNESLLAHTQATDAKRGLYDVSIAGKYRRVEVLDELTSASARIQEQEKSGHFVLQAPMPGLVVAIQVKPGDRVEIGSPLVVMEAMKMQNELVSEVAGTVREIRAELQQAVESGAVLVLVEGDPS